MPMSPAASRNGKAEASRSPTPGHTSQVLVAVGAAAAVLAAVVAGGVLAVVIPALDAEVAAALLCWQPVTTMQLIRAAAVVAASERVLSLLYMFPVLLMTDLTPGGVSNGSVTFPGIGEHQRNDV